MKKSDKILSAILTFATIAVIIAIWAISSVSINNQFILPSVSQTVSAFFSVLKSAEFYLALLGTLARSFIAFLLSFILAWFFALFANRITMAERVINTIISIFRALPTIAVVLLLLLWTNSFIAPIIVTMLVVLPTTYTQLKNAIDGVPKAVKEASMVDGAGQKEVFRYIELPIMQGDVFSAIGGGLTLNIKLMVAAEVLSQTANSIGYLLNTSKVYFETATMLAIVVFTVIIGIIIETVFNNFSKKASSWR